MERVGVIGCGAWGTTFAKLLAEKGHKVGLWCHDGEIARHITLHRRHPFVLKDIPLPGTISTKTLLSDLIEESDFLVLSVASSYISILNSIKPVYKNTPLLGLTKGVLENQTTLFVSDYIKNTLEECPYGVLSGPNLASEIAQNYPAATVIASKNPDVAAQFQRLVNSPFFRVYTSSDVKGVEIGGILKNVIAIAAGIVDGLELGLNAKGALMARGLQEMIRFGQLFSAKSETFYGLSGLGDLIATSCSPKSRNWRVGYTLAKDGIFPDLSRQFSQDIPEGVKTAKLIRNMALNTHLDMPIIFQVYAILYEQKTPRDAITELFSRELRSE